MLLSVIDRVAEMSQGEPQASPEDEDAETEE
jgi:hypothetical protein